MTDLNTIAQMQTLFGTQRIKATQNDPMPEGANSFASYIPGMAQQENRATQAEKDAAKAFEIARLNFYAITPDQKASLQKTQVNQVFEVNNKIVAYQSDRGVIRFLDQSAAPDAKELNTFMRALDTTGLSTVEKTAKINAFLIDHLTNTHTTDLQTYEFGNGALNGYNLQKMYYEEQSVKLLAERELDTEDPDNRQKKTLLALMDGVNVDPVEIEQD